MNNLETAGAALLLLAIAAIGAWLVSLRRNDVGIVDLLWSQFFVIALLTYLFIGADELGERQFLLLALVLPWAFRLSWHIGKRNHGRGEDRRYQEIRARNEPGFRTKSLYLVFLLQAVIAWIVSAPLFAAALGTQSATGLGLIDYLGVGLWLTGMIFESRADAELARFQKSEQNEGRVLDTGLWRYSRHPNYFGEFLIWWGYFCIAVGAGGAWTVFSPLIMTLLLLRVSGVSLMETGITERRPAYADYIRRTSAFFPLPPKTRVNRP